MTSPCDENEEPTPLMPVRRLHNFVYCPRLFYLQWVEGVFVPNEDTVIGSGIHSAVDSPDKLREESLSCEGGTLRSIALSSEQLGLTGVIDLLEHDGEGKRQLVDYKKGSPLYDESGALCAKPNDAIQLAAYALLLREAGIEVSGASIYYAQSKRHVAVQLTDALYDECLQTLEKARAIAASGVCPPPLCHFSRCFSCSAYSVCLPYETRYWSEHKLQNEEIQNRPPMSEKDSGEILVIQNPKAMVGLHSGNIEVRLGNETVSRHPIHQLATINLYGAIQISAQAVQALLEQGIPISYFNPAGRFLGLSHGLPVSGIDARLGQSRLWGCPEKRLRIASAIIRAKIHNQRVIIMRNGSAPQEKLRRLAHLRDSCAAQCNLSALRGIEGNAAAIYFSYFATMLKEGVAFDFTKRNKRPPRDEINSLLSLAYSVLAKELTGVAYTVGLDPFIGFFHSPRYGRPALALDMMEEFRPLIADSVVLTLINRGEITTEDFVHTTKGIFLKDAGRRQFWRAWTRRMDTEITHPVFGYKMSYRRMLHIQMRQFWRFCRGDSSEYIGFTTR